MAGLSVGTFRALDVNFTIRAPKELADTLKVALADLTDEHTPASNTLEVLSRGAGFYDVLWNDEIEAEGVDIGLALYQVMICINQRAATAAAVTDTVLHAGVVEWKGRAVALVGASGSGKTTLTVAAVLGGFGYVGDEVCAIDTTTNARPFHRPPGLRRGGAEVLGIEIPSDRMYRHTFPFPLGGHGRLTGRVPMGAVAMLRYGIEPPSVVQNSPGYSLGQLANQTLGSKGNERLAFDRLRHLVDSLPVFTVSYPTTAHGLDALRSILSATGRSTPASG